MTLTVLRNTFCICQVSTLAGICWGEEFLFLGKTDEELSLVCTEEAAPPCCTACSGGWRALKILGPLDLSLTGVLAGILTLLAEREVGIFALSTYNTDYILVREQQLSLAVTTLRQGGYETEEQL